MAQTCVIYLVKDDGLQGWGDKFDSGRNQIVLLIRYNSIKIK